MNDRPPTSFDINRFDITCEGCDWAKYGSGNDDYWRAYHAAAKHRKVCDNPIVIHQTRRWVQGTARKDKAA